MSPTVKQFFKYLVGETELRLKVAPFLFVIIVSTLLFADPFEVPKPSAGMVVRPNMTGLLGQLMQNNYNAIDASVSWAIGEEGYLCVHADKITYLNQGLRIKNEFFPLYYGFGGMVEFQKNAYTNTNLLTRLPFGITFKVRKNPVRVFAEVVPMVSLVPTMKYEISAGLGLRYSF